MVGDVHSARKATGESSRKNGRRWALQGGGLWGGWDILGLPWWPTQAWPKTLPGKGLWGQGWWLASKLPSPTLVELHFPFSDPKLQGLMQWNVLDQSCWWWERGPVPAFRKSSKGRPGVFLVRPEWWKPQIRHLQVIAELLRTVAEFIFTVWESRMHRYADAILATISSCVVSRVWACLPDAFRCSFLNVYHWHLSPSTNFQWVLGWLTITIYLGLRKFSAARLSVLKQRKFWVT